MTMRTQELIEEGSALTFAAFPKWEIFLSPPERDRQRFWLLRWDNTVLCKRTGAYLDPTNWTCTLRTICCGTGFGNDQGSAYCLHCGNPTVYGSEVQTRQDGAGVPLVQHARHWFEPFTDPLTAELLADEVALVAAHAETLIQDFDR